MVNAAIDDYEDDLELRPEVTAPKSDEKEAAAEAVKQVGMRWVEIRRLLALLFIMTPRTLIKHK